MEPSKNVLLPVDIEDVSEVAVEAAFDAARGRGVRVDLVYVYMPRGMEAWVTDAEMGEFRRELESKLTALFSTQTRAGLVGQACVRFGEPAQVIRDAAREFASAVIVVGTHGRHGLERLWLGSVAEEVVRTAECPVLVAKAPRTAEEK